MGLVLKKGDKVYLDANIFIYSVEEKQPYADKIKGIYHEIVRKNAIVITSDMTICEVLVKPFKVQNIFIANAFKTALTPHVYLNVVPITRDILIKAAEIRASSSLKTPDAIHLATVIAMQCDYFITNDKAFKTASYIETLSLDEI
jgi:predicted nucleic acid-binding protein